MHAANVATDNTAAATVLSLVVEEEAANDAPAAPAANAATQSVMFEIEHDNAPEIDTHKKPNLSMTIQKFVDDFRHKVRPEVAFIDIIAFIDKMDIKTGGEDTARPWTRGVFCPSRINIIDAKRNPIGFIPVDKLLQIYGEEFKLSVYETQWTKFNKSVKINVIHVNMTPKTSKAGKAYIATDILPIPETNTKAVETMMKYYDATPTSKWQRPTEYNDDKAFADDVEEYNCVI